MHHCKQYYNYCLHIFNVHEFKHLTLKRPSCTTRNHVVNPLVAPHFGKHDSRPARGSHQAPFTYPALRPKGTIHLSLHTLPTPMFVPPPFSAFQITLITQSPALRCPPLLRPSPTLPAWRRLASLNSPCTWSTGYFSLRTQCWSWNRRFG